MTYVESNMDAVGSDITGSGATVLTQMLLTLPFVLDVLGMNPMQLLCIRIHIQSWNLVKY